MFCFILFVMFCFLFFVFILFYVLLCFCCIVFLFFFVMFNCLRRRRYTGLIARSEDVSMSLYDVIHLYSHYFDPRSKHQKLKSGTDQSPGEKKPETEAEPSNNLETNLSNTYTCYETWSNSYIPKHINHTQIH